MAQYDDGPDLFLHPAATIVVGPDGSITFWNDSAQRLLGYSRDEALGQDFESLLVPSARRDERLDVLDQAMDAGSACLATERNHKNGDAIPVSVTVDFVSGDGQANGTQYVTMREMKKLRCLCGATVLNAPKRPIKELTNRQRQVLRLIAEGKSTRDIASRLALSIKTIETHRGHLMQRLKLKSVAGLVRYAVSIGLVPPSPWAARTATAEVS